MPNMFKVEIANKCSYHYAFPFSFSIGIINFPPFKLFALGGSVFGPPGTRNANLNKFLKSTSGSGGT